MTTQALSVSLQYSHSIGRGEFSGPGFRNPVAIARGADDVMYVVNRSYEYRPDGKRVTICTVDEEYIGEFARGVHTAGITDIVTEDGSLIWPTSVTLDQDGNVYIADEWLNRISIFTKDGEWVGTWGTEGSGDGEISRPPARACDAAHPGRAGTGADLEYGLTQYTKRARTLQHYLGDHVYHKARMARLLNLAKQD